MLKSKIQSCKFADLIGFIKQFMNREASHLAREALRSCTKYKAFIGRRVGKEVISRRKERMVSGQDLFFLGEGNSRDFILQVTSLVLTRKFQIDYIKRLHS